MANTISDVVPKLIGMMLPKLRANSIMPRLVNRSFETSAATKHSTVDVPIPPTVAVQDVTPANTPPSTADLTFSTVQVPLSNWKEAPFYMTDKDLLEVSSGVLPGAAAAALAALVDSIDTSILTAMSQGASRAVGTIGSPFSTLAAAIAPSTELNTNLIPRGMRHVVMDPAAEGALLALNTFSDAQFVGNVEAMTDGAYNGNRRLGMQWWMNQNVPTHTKGTGLNYLVNAGGGLAVGTTTIPVDTGSGTILAGDVVTFAGTGTKYVVTSALSGGSFEIGAPGLLVAESDNDAVTVGADHVANLAFQQDAVVFVSRPFEASNASVASQVMADPVSGLSLRLEVTREHKRDRWSLDALWGVKVVRSQGVIKITG